MAQPSAAQRGTQPLAQAAAKPGMSALFAEFGRYFDLSLALTGAQKAAVFAVRYSVYCQEFGYEDARAFKDGLEKDVFDERSIHCLVTHTATGTAAGCVRLVTVGEDTRLPLEEHCQESLDQSTFTQLARHRENIAEISRLAVDGQFRRRRGESETRFGNTETLHFAAREQRTFSLIAVALFLASASVADLLKRPACFAIMEPFLPVILRRTGIVVQRVGENFDYRGERAPYYLHVGEAARALPEELRLCYDAIKDQFAKELVSTRERHELKRVQSRVGTNDSQAISALDCVSAVTYRRSTVS